jgi:hypothetical protein
MIIEFDITSNKHGGNPQSELAFEKVRTYKDGNFILKYIEENGAGYLKQIARAMGKQKNEISGRFSELKRDKLIEPLLDKDGNKVILEGCQVYQKTMRLI